MYKQSVFYLGGGETATANHLKSYIVLPSKKPDICNQKIPKGCQTNCSISRIWTCTHCTVFTVVHEVVGGVF